MAGLAKRQQLKVSLEYKQPLLEKKHSARLGRACTKAPAESITGIQTTTTRNKNIPCVLAGLAQRQQLKVSLEYKQPLLEKKHPVRLGRACTKTPAESTTGVQTTTTMVYRMVSLLTRRVCVCHDAGLEVGQPVATLSGGCFADYIVMPAKFCLPAGTVQKEVVALLTSGLTASIGWPLLLNPLPPLPPPLAPPLGPTPPSPLSCPFTNFLASDIYQHHLQLCDTRQAASLRTTSPVSVLPLPSDFGFD